MQKKIYVSASQIENYRSCPRRWWFRSVKKLAEPQSEAQAMGDRFAKAIEARLKGQIIPKFDELTDVVVDRFLNAAYTFFPQEANPEIYAERKIEFDVPDLPAKMIGYIDVLDLSGASAHIRDHKTRSDKKYAPTHEKLATDLQLNIYAYAIRLDLPDARFAEATIGHINYIKPPKQFAKNIEYLRNEWQPEVFIRQIPLDGQRNDDVIDGIKPLIEDMVRYSDSLLTPDKVPFDTTGEACYSYGQPCTYSAICPKFNLTPRLIIRDFDDTQSTRPDMSMKSLPPRPPQRVNGVPVVAPPAAPAAPAAPAPPAAPVQAANLPPRPPSRLNMNGATFAAPAPAAPAASLPPRPPAANVPPKPPARLSMGAPVEQPRYVEMEAAPERDNGINPPSNKSFLSSDAAVVAEAKPSDNASPPIPVASILNLSQKARTWLEASGFTNSVEVAHLNEAYLMGAKLPKTVFNDLLKMSMILRGLHRIAEPDPFENCPELGGKPEKVSSKAEILEDLPNHPGTPPLNDAPAISGPPKGFVPTAPRAEPIMDPEDVFLEEPVTQKIAALSPVVTPPTQPPFYLYLECFPIKGATFVTLEEWLDPIFCEIEQEAGVTNWRSIVEFGRMNEMLHVAIRNVIEGNTQYSLPEHLVVLSSYTEYAKAILDLLIRRATLVVKK